MTNAGQLTCSWLISHIVILVWDLSAANDTGVTTLPASRSSRHAYSVTLSALRNGIRKVGVMNAFFKKLLRINLSNNSYQYQTLPEELLSMTLGGKGLGTYLLLTENTPQIDPFSPANVFIIATGPVTGTRLWGSSRFAVFTKSPATGGFGESYCGGSLAGEIKGCGVDAVLLEGKCDTLTYLTIDESGVEFHDATDIAGKESFQSEEYILAHAPKGAHALVIGPAGENLVTFACIKSDRWRSLGRCGMGAVLGSKNCKGIAFSGSLRPRIANSESLKEFNRRIAVQEKNSQTTQRYRTYGTPSMVAVTNNARCFPTKYWSSGFFSEWQNISADYMHENFTVKPCGCSYCFLQCTKHSTINTGRHTGLELEGPEFETIYALGGLNAIDSLEEIAWLNDACDRLGIDTMSAGNISAFAIEANKRGKIDFSIDYNQPERVHELLRLVTSRQGVGDLLAQGIAASAHQLDLSELAIHVKGLEPAGFDPRVLKGMGLAYATSARGACHLRGTFYKAELSGEVDSNSIEGKAELFVDYEDRAALFDSLVLCRFFRDFYLWPELSEIVAMTTGMKLSKEDLQARANLITEKSRAYNSREGIGSLQDVLPSRFTKEPINDGDLLKSADLATMLRDYNEIRRSTRENHPELRW